MNTGDLILIAAAWVLAVVPVLQGADARQVAGFADLYTLPTDSVTTAEIDATLTRTRRFRAVGAAASITVTALVVSSDMGLWSVLGVVAAGFALGSVADELTRSSVATTTAVATLERRVLRTYVERWVLWFGAVMSVVLVVQLWIAIDLARTDGLLTPDGSSDGLRLSGRAVAFITALLIVALVAIAFLLRRIVTRRFDAADPTRRVVLHAIRTSTVLSLVGAALMLVGAVSGWLALDAVLEDGATHPAVQWVNNLTILAAAVAVAFGASLSLFATPRRGGSQASKIGRAER